MIREYRLWVWFEVCHLFHYLLLGLLTRISDCRQAPLTAGLAWTSTCLPLLIEWHGTTTLLLVITHWRFRSGKKENSNMYVYFSQLGILFPSMPPKMRADCSLFFQVWILQTQLHGVERFDVTSLSKRWGMCCGWMALCYMALSPFGSCRMCVSFLFLSSFWLLCIEYMPLNP